MEHHARRTQRVSADRSAGSGNRSSTPGPPGWCCRRGRCRARRRAATPNFRRPPASAATGSPDAAAFVRRNLPPS
ncbi:MAG: hypothetical protein DWQ34_28525 [Planctomycetota bacterium]|nr:MAG: hypothetical protein DWQ29_21930 [Planctomycetota bacterium]REJ85707.1 MAG: hypothetical protein DWQ34_28525 [Planctomycetota bacterium]REK21471.1 MAG: hypothetical protein DWQ41_21545 [Planctomycetota bacterium]REK40138.1 MAG: hypothetical protein DWQ45_00500 [Planctomycetota bacterium]